MIDLNALSLAEPKRDHFVTADCGGDLSSRCATPTPGHTRREVHDALGPPDDWSAAHQMFARRATVWLYGPLELHFAPDPAGDARLHMIWCDYIPFMKERVSKRGSLRLAPWIFAGVEPVSQAALESALRSESLAFEVRRVPLLDTQRVHLVLAHDVVFGVDDEGDGPVVVYLQIKA